MNRTRRASFLVLIPTLLLLAALPAAAASDCPDLVFRIWQKEDQTYHDYGDTIELEAGVPSHLYIHYRGDGDVKFSVSADIGPAADFGHARVDRVRNVRLLGLGVQQGDDRRAGRLEMVPRERGLTAVGYRIVAVSSPGLFERLPVRCREGLVRFNVVAEKAPGYDRPGGERAKIRAVRQLSHRVVASLMPWIGKVDIASLPLDDVAERGRAALSDLAVAVLRDDPFRTDAYSETVAAHPELRRNPPRVIASHLLDDIYRHLYGDLRVREDEHERHVNAMLGCVSNQPGWRQYCAELGQALIANPSFAQHNEELLAALEE